MSMTVEQLETLLAKLERLADALDASSKPADAPLANDDPLVRQAEECEFMLPSRLTVANLADTVERKIDNVQLLLERARQNQDIPQEARIAAANEDNPVRPGLH